MTKDRTIFYRIGELDDPNFEGPYDSNQLRLFPQNRRHAQVIRSTMVLLFICRSCGEVAQMFDHKELFALSQYEHETETLLCPECSRNDNYPDD